MNTHTLSPHEIAVSRAILRRAERRMRAMALRFLFAHYAGSGAQLRRILRAMVEGAR